VRGVSRTASRVGQGLYICFQPDLFTATITDMDEQGVRELLFEFREVVDSPNYHFYLGSPQFMAYQP
jgi:hypothetical protein